MRNKPDIQFSINTPNRSNMTLYEMSESMSENGDAQEAFPYLIKWLMKDFWSNYKYNGIPYSDEYAYNIAYFVVYNFINREICSKKPEVFRSKFLKEIVNMNLDSDFNNILQDIKNATAELQSSKQDSYSSEKNSNKTRTDNLKNTSSSTNVTDSTNKTTYNNTRTNNIENNNSITYNEQNSINGTNTLNKTSDNTTTVNGEHNNTNTVDITNKIDSENNITDSGSNRIVGSDYPQSTVDTTHVGDWDYASNAQDTTTKSTNKNVLDSKDVKSGTTQDVYNENNKTVSSLSGVDTTTINSLNKHTGENSSSQSGTTTDSKTGSDTNDIDSTVTNNGEVNYTGTVNNTDVDNINGSDTVESSWTNLSGIQLNELQLSLYDKYGTFYSRLLTNLEHCFLSIYIDDDRDGYIDPLVNLMSAW